MAILDYKEDSQGLNSVYSSMPPSCGLVKVIDYLTQSRTLVSDPLIFLANAKIVITMITRNYTPDYKTYNDLIAYFATSRAKDNYVGVTYTFDQINAKFFQRGINGGVSENEWIYKDVIMKSSDPLNDPKFVKYSAHMPCPNKVYGSAIDIRARDFSPIQRTTIVNQINNQFGLDTNENKWMWALAHTVDGNAIHIHIQDDIQWNGVKNQVIASVNEACGYKGINTRASISAAVGAVNNQNTFKAPNIQADDCGDLVTTDQAEQAVYKDNPPIPEVITEIPDSRVMLPDDIQDDGLMDVLRIGDIDFSLCPVAQISYSQSMQYVRFSALRTVGDPKIVTETMPNNISVNIVFPNMEAIMDLQALYTHFMVTPVTIVESRFISRVLNGIITDHMGKLLENKFKSATDESMWMIMTDFNVRSIPGFPEAFEAFITLEYFEDRVFGGHMEYLVDKNDLIEKYRKKQTMFNNQYILPSDITIIQTAKNYQGGTLKTTPNPNQSKLYHDFYTSVWSKMPDYVVDDPNKGLFEVIYNAQDFSRQHLKEIKNKLAATYLNSLKHTQDIINTFGPNEKAWIISLGEGPIYSSDAIKQISKGMVASTSQQLQMALENSSYTEAFQGVRFSVMDIAQNFNTIIRDADNLVESVCDEQGIPQNLHEPLKEVLTATLNHLGGAENISNGLFSPDVIKNRMANNVPAASIGMLDGFGGSLEILYASKLFVGIDVKDSKQVTQRVEIVQKALNAIAQLALNPLNSKANLDQDGMDQFPNKYIAATILDGNNNICTGVSFTIQNKVVPQQIIGWRQPTYQHLGRSDWSINMNIICKGDSGVKNIMFILNRLGILSKQIQYTSPGKYMNLDTVLHITKADPIFAALGINSVVLNTVEVSSIPNQPNTYQINLGMEQSDLSIYRLEALEPSQAKQIASSNASALMADIVPILKALIIRPDHPNYGRFLDFKHIKEVVTDPALDPVWVALGLQPKEKDGISQYDYMDKYNFFKMVIQETSVTNPETNWSTVLEKEFPDKNAFHSPDISKLMEALNEKGFPGTDTFNKLKILFNLINNEANGDTLIWKKGSVKEPDKLALSLNGYFQGVQQLVNSYLTNVADTLNKISVNGTGPTLHPAIGGAAAGLTTLLAVCVVSGPPGWIGLGVVLAGIAIGAGVTYLANTESDVAKQLVDIVPTLLPSVFKIVVNQQVVELAQEFVADQTSLDMFTADFVIDDLTGVTLQTKIHQLRDAMGAAMTGCYNDFNKELVEVANSTGLPIGILDPAFYLYSQDFITTDLIKEIRSDITNQMSFMVARMHVTALQVGFALEDKYKPDSNLNFTTDQALPSSELASKTDLEWAISVKRALVDITKKTMQQPNDATLKEMQNAQIDGNTARSIYFQDAYWDSTVVADKTNAVLEIAFARLLSINNTLRFDAIKQAMDHAALAINQKIGDIKNNPKYNKDIAQNIIEYNRFFKDQIQGKKIHSYDGQTWYSAILTAGSLDNPYNYSGSVNAAYKDLYGKDMVADFSEPMVNIINQVDVLAKCKKASVNPVSAEMMATYNALSNDPRMLTRRVEQVTSVSDTLYKASFIDLTGNPIKIFPTYKVYFIEENAQEWGIFNDFYDYSAIQEITVVKDRTSASDICTIKLSNITGKLTDTFADNIPNRGLQSLPAASMMLKAGVSILVKMGYSNSQVELPVVFYGIVMEVQPGPVVEIICQGYGAELNERVAPNEGMHFGVFGTVKALGDVATWALQQATGLSHFGILNYANFGTKDSLRLSGGDVTGDQGTFKIASYLSGLPGLSINDPKDDNIYLPYNVSKITSDGIEGTLDAGIKYLQDKLNLAGNLAFSWYIRDQSIWDILHEIVLFSPDFIQLVLPYNDNQFPFIPKVRNTLYVGPKQGYYKYTDLYKTISKNTSISFPDINKLGDYVIPIAYQFWYYVRNPLRVENGVQAGDNPSIINTAAIAPGMDELTDKLDVFFTNNPQLAQLMSTLLGVTYRYNSQYTYVTRAGSGGYKNASAVDFSNAFVERYTNFNTINTNSDFVQSQIAINVDIENLLKFAINQDIGLNGIYYNMRGGNHQYRKVQQHHIATAYTNILNNNIIASGEGWANKIKLICPNSPQNYVDKEDVPIDNRSEFVITPMCLDDNILDDQIRVKEVFINNINPHNWDDSTWADKALEGSATWTNVREDTYSSFDSNRNPTVVPLPSGGWPINDPNLNINSINNQPYARNGWELMPSRWRIAISLLAEEARNMYNGELTITGNSNIKPYDVIHIIDPINEMDGSFEVGRVIHSISPQTGFVTRIKPDLIINQKNKFNASESHVFSTMVSMAHSRTAWATGLAVGGTVLGGLATAGSITAGIGLLGNSAALLAASISSVVGIVLVPAILLYSGYKALDYYYDKKIMILNNIIGRDCLEIEPLTYKGLPYIAGCEGLKKESFLRHGYGMAFSKQSKLNIFERMSYSSAPIESEFYSKVCGDSSVFTLFQITNTSGIKGPGLTEGAFTLRKAIMNPGGEQ